MTWITSGSGSGSRDRKTKINNHLKKLQDDALKHLNKGGRHAENKANDVGLHLTKLHDKTFKHLNRVGRKVEKVSSKLNVESFWPGPMPKGEARLPHEHGCVAEYDSNWAINSIRDPESDKDIADDD